ncbi:TlpA family protein disulfide reductase [Streptomyces sp. NPDC059009]|uniref:TlpA family protein disulfide reductase n=1 Tax=Streptomyces sp. NPDC059009 TaxID=3346694 RepID=UPI003698A65B
MKTKTLTLRTAAAVSLLALVCGCSSGGAADKGKRTGPLKSYAPADRKQAPAWSGETVDGKKIDLAADYRGKVVVVNAWASWCPPCRLEAPGLSRFNKEMKDKDVAVVGMNADANVASARSFENDKKLSYPSLHDPAGRKLLQMPKGLANPTTYPYTLFFDRKGRIAASYIGAISETKVNDIVKPLTKE